MSIIFNNQLKIYVQIETKGFFGDIVIELWLFNWKSVPLFRVLWEINESKEGETYDSVVFTSLYQTIPYMKVQELRMEGGQSTLTKCHLINIYFIHIQIVNHQTQFWQEGCNGLQTPKKTLYYKIKMRKTGILT